MKFTIDIIIAITLIYWPPMMMMSPMMLGAPGAIDDKSNINSLLVGIFYPTFIFSIYKLFGANYFNLPINLVLLFTLAITISICVLFGYPRIFLNVYMGIPNRGYFVAENAVYLDGVQIKNALPDSFKTLGGEYSRYSKDKYHVFHERKIIADADPSTFEPVPDHEKQSEESHHDLFWKDKNHVYVDGIAIKNAKPDTFKHLADHYGYDENNVYYKGNALDKAKPNKFVLLDSNIGKDDQNLYIYDKRVSISVDIRTLSLVGDKNESISYCKDKSHVYVILYQSASLNEIVGADPASFIQLDRGYAKDKRGVYYQDSTTNKIVTLEDAVSASFKVTNYDDATASDAKDNRRYYLSGKLVALKSQAVRK